MAKTINAKEILADIKAGMDDSALMEKYGLSEKGLQSLFEKLTYAGALKQREPEKRPSGPHKVIEYTWKCPACGKPQTKRSDQCPECGKIGSRIKTQSPEQVEEIEGRRSEGGPDPSSRKTFQDFLGKISVASSPALDKVKTILRKPYVAAIAGAAIMLLVTVVFFGLHRRGGEAVQSKVVTSRTNQALNPPFIDACRNGDENLVKTLWKRGADTNAEERCDTPLLVASVKGHKSIVRFLLKNGADPNLRNSCSGSAPLHAAAVLLYMQRLLVTAQT